MAQAREGREIMANDIFDSMLGEVQEGTFAPSPELEKPEEQDPIFGELLQREAAKTQEQGYIAAVRGQRANPDGYAEDTELAKTFGVPVDFVGRNRERLKSFKGIQDAQRLFDADPVLGQFYASGDNADAIKIDELRQFSGMKWLALAAGQAFKSGRADVNLANARYAELMGTASGEQIRAADLMSQGRDGRTFGADSWLEKGWAGTFQQLPNMIETLLGGVDQGIKGAIGGATIAAVAGQLGPQVALPEEVLTVPAGAAAGYKVGAVAGQLKASFRLQSGLAFDEFKNMKDADGRPMDQDVAKGAALISGAAGAILETIGFQAMAKLVPGLDKVAGHLTVDGVKAAIARPTVAAALKTFAQNIAKSGATEVTTEVLQEGIQIFAGEMAKSMANGEGADFAFMSSDDITGRLAETFEQTLQTMTIMGPALSGTRLGLDVRRARQASSDAAVIQALNEHAQGNELNARLPEKAKEVVRTLTENGPVKTVYVNPTAFSTFFQTSEEIGAYAAEIGITDEYNEASRTGRDMEIPIDVYYSSIAGTEIGQAIRDFVKLDPDRMDMNEANAFNEAWAEAAQEVATQAERDYLTTTAAVTAVEEIHADVKDRAMNAGLVPDQAEQYAKLYSTFFRVMGDRTGQDPGEVYRKYGFEIRRAIPGWDNEYKPVDGLNISLEAIRKGAVDPLRKRVEKSKGASLLDAIKARGGIEDAGGDLASLNAPKGVIRKGTAGQASMLAGGDNQYSADDVARQMWEEGYFPEFEDRPTANDLIDAIAEEMGGTKRFKAQVTRDPAVERAEALVTFADELDRLGLDPNRMTDDDIRAELERIIADDPNTGALYQAAVPNMIVQHNLTSANLLHADKIRGLAVPSVAISSVEAPLTNFGEITLLGDVDMIDPRKDSASKVFNADVYSPRYPTLRYKIATKEMNKAWKKLSKASEDLGHVLSGELDNNEVERQGLEAFRNSSAVQLTYLRETGQEIELPQMKAATNYLEKSPEIASFVNEYDTVYEVLQKPEAVAAISAAIDLDVARNLDARDDFSEADIRGWYYGKDGEIRSDVIRKIQSEISISKRPGIDRSAARYELRDQISWQQEEFSAWIDENFSSVISGETVMAETASGDIKYLPHTLDNVVKILKKKLRDGEGFNYGVASIRSNVARQFKNVAAIKAARGDLISREAMQALKEEVDNEFVVLAGRFEEFMPSQRGYGFLDTFSEHLKEVASRGVTVLDKYYTDLPDDLKQAAARFLDKLTNMPTEYFEAKLQRAVELSEFKAAVIPSDAPKETRDVLTYARVPVVEYDPGVEGSRAEAIRAASEQQRILFQEGTQEGEDAAGVKRGSIQFGEGRTIINMFEAANPSTFLHESGHFFLEVFRDLAVQEGGTGTVSADWLVAKEYLGITDDAAISVEAHEKFARSFEAYLFEGKAPSNEVAGIFSRFRSWLVFVYQSVSNLNVPINDKIRGVMDRLVATDEEIRLAQTGSDFRPQFASAEEAGMSPAQWKDYVEVAGRAVEKATRELSARMLQDVRRETSTEWRNAKREIREQVATEFGRLPVYQVINYLRTGKTTMLPETMQRVYLDRDSIVEVMGEGALLKMPKSVPPLYRAADGLHADSLAEMFGYPSGHEMLTNIMSARPLNRAIVEETDLRMRQRFGDLMGDAVARAREVSAAIDNDATGELLMAEMEVLMKKGLVTTKLRKQDAQRVAREAVRGKNIREAVRVKLYQNANLRAAQEVEKAIIAGDWKAAVSAKQRQVLNHFMAVEAREAEKDTESAVRYLNKFAGRTRPKGIDPEYLDQIEGVLERFDLRKSISLKDAQRRNSLAAWIQEQEAQGHIVDVPDVLRRDAFRKPYKEMTVDDLLAVRDAVKNIEHLGRLKDKLLSNKEQREFLGARDEMLAALEAHQDKRKEPGTRNPTPVMLALETARSLEASQLKMEQVFDWMDGGDVNGPFNRYIWRPIAKAEARENELRAEYAAKIAMAFQKLDKDRLTARITIPGVAQTFRRSEIMAIALNMGNASNLDKMLRGEGWTQEILDRAVANLNDAEWETVQEVWDIINSLWPEIAALQKRLAGVVPPKVEARKFVTPTGKEMKGGYYPAIYDPRRSADVEDRAAANADLFIENTYLRPDTPRGFTKERAQMYARPMLFDLDAIGNHINGVIHDLTHREAIMDAVKFVTNGAVRNEIETRYGKAIYQQITPWLQSIAKDMQPNEGLNAVNKVFRSVRSRATMVAMGFRVSTMLAQIAGISSSAEMVPIKHLAGAIKDFGLNPAAMWREVDSLSGEMKFRQQTLDRDIKERLRELTGATSAADRARRFAFYGIGYLDRVVTVPTWMAAYRDHLSRYPTDKEGAIAHADKVVRLTQGSGGAKDLSALQRRNELTKLVTMFYSYFAAYYNRQRAWGRDAAKAVKAGNVREFPQLLARQVFMTIGPALLGEMLTGKGPEEDEDWEKWALRKVALYPVAAVPVARDFANYFNNGFDYSFTPIERTLNDMIVKPIELVGDIVEGEADARKASKVVINGAGLWFNLPTGQLATSVDNVWRAIEEDDFQLRDIVLTRPAK
jgi:hypothetical protein